ncbi:MAG: acyl carrier protein [Armatimonadetes bacterium]|nr:acyl carrier protein [Armatimonadota bacterium]
MEDVLNRVRKVIVEELNRKEDEINLESSFMEDFGADSLDVVQLVMGFEDEFNIEIPDDEVESIKTVGAAVDYISKKLEEKSA